MSLDFNQQSLDSSQTVGQQTVAKLETRVHELEAQVEYYEKQAFEHKQLETHMRNSYALFLKDVDNAKRDLALSDQRNQELRQENIKLNAQLSGKIDVLLNERHELNDRQAMVSHTWFVSDSPTTAFIRQVVNQYDTIKLTVDTENNRVDRIMGIDKLQRSS